MKPYAADYFDWFGTLLFGVYGLVLFIILWAISAVFLENKREQLFCCIAFIFLSLFVWVAAYSSLMPYLHDTDIFSYIVEEGVVNVESRGVNLYYLISKPLVILSAYQIEVYLLFQQFIFILALLFIWKGWQIHCENLKIKTGLFEVFVLLAVIYPSTILYITTPLREFIQILGFSIFLYGLAVNLQNGKWLWLIIGVVLTLFVRPQLILIYPILILIAKQKNIFKLLAYGLGIVPLILLAFNVMNYHFRVSWFARFRNASIEHYGGSGMTYGYVEWQTYSDLLLDLPVLALQFLLSPMPIMHDVNPLSLLMLFLDFIFVSFVLFGALSIKFRVSGTYLKIFIYAITLFAMKEFFIGGAVRHRFPLILMILPLASMYYSHVIASLLRHRQKQQLPVSKINAQTT